jgi:branched-chain amino acid transport system substrate-binding protein
MRTHRRAAFVGVALALVLAAACGGDDDDGGSAEGTSVSATTDAAATTAAPETTAAAATTEAAETTAAEAETTEAPDETSGGPATGEPIQVIGIGSFESPTLSVPWTQTAIEVRVEAINEAGGINGRPIEVEFCNDRSDPNEASACARRAGEIGAVAALGGVTQQAPAILPVLAEAGIPWLGGMGSSGVIELEDPNAWPLHGGATGLLYGVGKAMVDAGGTKFAVITTDTASSVVAGETQAAAIEAAGGATPAIHYTTADTVDFSAVVATALEGGTDAVAITTVVDQAPKIVQALRQAGYEGIIGTSSSHIPQPAIDALGADAEGILIGFRLVPVVTEGNATIDQYTAEMTARQPDIRLDELGLNAWASVNLFADLAERLETVDGESLTAELQNLSDPVDLGEIIPPYGSLEAPAEFPQARNFVAIVADIEGGTYVQQGDFVNPFES